MLAKKVGLFLTASLLLVAVLTAQQTRQADIELQAAIRTETVQGDLKAAIRQYEALIEKYSSDDTLVASALLRMAECHRLLGDAQEAKIYERIVRYYPHHKEAATAQARLAALGSSGVSASRMSRRRVYSAPSMRSYGTISSEGRWISSTPGGVSIHELASGTTRVLVRPAEGSYALQGGSFISPDSRQVAYLWLASGQGLQVRVVSINGDAEPQIVYRSPSFVLIKGWTPDGRNLLVTEPAAAGSTQIGLLSIQDGSIRQLKTLNSPGIRASISPDGMFIAFEAPADGTNGNIRDIFIMPVETNEVTTVVQHSADDHSPIWSPDGARILFVSERTATPSLWSVPLKYGKPAGPAELIRSDTGSILPLTMTRTGTLYYWVSGSSRNVYRAMLGSDGKVSGTAEIVTETYVHSNWGASLSRDGRQLAYYSDRPNTVLVIRDLLSGKESVYALDLEVLKDDFDGPQWLPDGRSVLAAGTKGRSLLLHRVDLNSGTVEDAGFIGLGFRAWPDGKSALDLSPMRNRLVRRGLTPGSIMTLAEISPETGITAFQSPAISNDGSKIAFVQVSPGDGKGLNEIIVANAAGGEARAVFRFPQGTNRANTLAWSPDNRHILFVRHEQSAQSIWRVPAQGGAAERVSDLIKGAIRGPQMHPDGRSIFFTAIEDNPDEIWALENFLPAGPALPRSKSSR